MTMQIASAKDKNPVSGELCFYGLLLRFGTSIILCSEFQSSSVIGLVIRMESKLMILGLP